MNRQDLLSRWTSALRQLQQEHELSSRFYEKLSWKLGIPAAVFSAVAGAAIFSARSGADITHAPLIAGICSVLAAAASATQTFLDCARRSMNHKIAGAKFAELVAQSELASVREIDATACDELLANIRSKWNIAQADAPNLRASVAKKINALLNDISMNKG